MRKGNFTVEVVFDVKLPWKRIWLTIAVILAVVLIIVFL